MRQGKAKILAWHCGDRAQSFFMHLCRGLTCTQMQHSTADKLTCTALRVETYLLQELKLWEEKHLEPENYFLLFPDFSVLYHHNKGIRMSGENVLTVTTPGISGFITIDSPCQIARLVQRTLINLNHSQLPVNYRLSRKCSCSSSVHVDSVQLSSADFFYHHDWFCMLF